MRRFYTIKYLTAFALALALAAFSGCVWLGEALSALTPAETDLPLGSTLPTAVPEATDAPYSDSDNPVLFFITGFQLAFAKASKGLPSFAYEKGGETQELAMRLMRDESRLCLVAATAGMLPDRTEVGSFTGTVTGAYAGSGVLTNTGDFSFTLLKGGEIKGSLLSAMLTAKVPDGSLSLYRNGSEYLLWFTDGDGTSVIRVERNELSFLFSGKRIKHSAELPGDGDLKKLEYSPGLQ